MKHAHALVALVLLLTACAKPVELNYTPTSTHTGSGQLALGQFQYHPQAMRDFNENQFMDTMGIPVFADRPIAEYVRDALAQEFQHAGYALNGKSVTLNANIMKAEMDQLSMQVVWTLSIDYELIKNRQPIYGTAITTTSRSAKFDEPYEGLPRAIRLSFEKLVSDPNVAKLLR